MIFFLELKLIITIISFDIYGGVKRYKSIACNLIEKTKSKYENYW